MNKLLQALLGKPHLSAHKSTSDKQADRNEVFLDFLYRVHKALGYNRVDDKVQFTVREVDAVANTSETMANHCRSLREHGLDPVEATEIFGKLVSGVAASMVEGKGGRGLWVYQAPERRKLLDWIREPGRMDLAMMAWMTK